MGENMLAFTGIKKESLERLTRKGVIVLEFLSFVNVRTASLLEKGDRVFLTEDVYEELDTHTEGIVGEVLEVRIAPSRVNIDHIDEVEVQRARVKVKFVSFGRVKEIEEERPAVTVVILDRALVG